MPEHSVTLFFDPATVQSSAVSLKADLLQAFDDECAVFVAREYLRKTGDVEKRIPCETGCSQPFSLFPLLQHGVGCGAQEQAGGFAQLHAEPDLGVRALN